MVTVLCVLRPWAPGRVQARMTLLCKGRACVSPQPSRACHSRLADRGLLVRTCGGARPPRTGRDGQREAGLLQPRPQERARASRLRRAAPRSRLQATAITRPCAACSWASLNGQKAWIALLELGIPFEERRIDRYAKDADFVQAPPTPGQALRCSQAQGLTQAPPVLPQGMAGRQRQATRPSDCGCVHRSHCVRGSALWAAAWTCQSPCAPPDSPGGP